MFDPALLRSLTGTPMQVRCAVLPARLSPAGAVPGAGGWAVLRVTVRNAGSTGQGEAALQPSLEAHGPDVLRDEFASARDGLERMISPVQLPGLLSPGPLRSALDSALWDLLAKRSGQRAWELLGMPPPRPVPAIRTVSPVAADLLEQELKDGEDFASLKLKLGVGDLADDLARLTAVRRLRPDAWLMVDVDGAWDADRLHVMLPILHAHGVRMLEQPLPQAQSAVLAALPRPFPIITDLTYGESADLGRLGDRYDGINLSLDAVGGLTAALGIMEQAGQRGLAVLLDSPPATALSCAPALHAAPGADHVTLPRWLDASGPGAPSLEGEGGMLVPPSPSLWG
ncbi:enolase C-terminal domain-like protein [Streptomyces sp. NPDC002755]|uniref:enolase C-terminal domain-like protein n=1 Tax=Streptomyces sp. NPDC002884 TaxID=3154544 RepID=UPI00332592FC